MKKPFLCTLATFALLFQGTGVGVAAAPKATSKHHRHMAAHIARMCQDREARVMMLHELTNTPERKREVAHLLKDDSYFREMFGNETTGGG